MHALYPLYIRCCSRSWGNMANNIKSCSLRASVTVMLSRLLCVKVFQHCKVPSEYAFILKTSAMWLLFEWLQCLLILLLVSCDLVEEMMQKNIHTGNELLGRKSMSVVHLTLREGRIIEFFFKTYSLSTFASNMSLYRTILKMHTC